MMRSRRLDDRGMSLTELLVSMAIFSILMVIVFAIMISLTYQAKDSLARAESVEQARLGLSQIDRQVRSGNVISDPALETWNNSHAAQYYSLRIFTQENNQPKCVQWRVVEDSDGFYNLEFRKWDPGYISGPAPFPWSVVAHNIKPTEKALDPSDPETWPPFFVDNSSFGTSDSHFVRITLRLLEPDSRKGAKPTTVTTVVTGRNTVFGYATSSCSHVPPP